MYLWQATRAYAETERRPWPVGSTVAMAYAEIARVFSSIPSPVQPDPVQPDPAKRHLSENGLTLAVMKDEVLEMPHRYTIHSSTDSIRIVVAMTMFT